MYNSLINYLSNMRQVLLFFFQHQTLWKNNRTLQNIHWTCLNIQLNYMLSICFLFLHVKIKTVQKFSLAVSILSWRVFMPLWNLLNRFYITFKNVAFWNREELFVLSGNKRPIWYEFHNDVKLNSYNGNMV